MSPERKQAARSKREAVRRELFFMAAVLERVAGHVSPPDPDPFDDHHEEDLRRMDTEYRVKQDSFREAARLLRERAEGIKVIPGPPPTPRNPDTVRGMRCGCGGLCDSTGPCPMGVPL